MKKTMAVAAIAMGMAGWASGAQFNFDNDGGDWLWSNPLNWTNSVSPDTLPGTADQARLQLAGGPVILDTPVSVLEYFGANAATSAVRIVTGGELTTTKIQAGNFTTSHSTIFEVDGGSVTNSSFFRAAIGSANTVTTGVCTVLMKSGSVTNATQTSIGYAGGRGVYIQTGGDWNSQSFRLGENQTFASGTAVISNGTLNLRSDVQVGMKGNGSMTINGGNVTASTLKINSLNTAIDANLSLLAGSLTLTLNTNTAVTINGDDKMHIEGGTFIWKGNRSEAINTLITAGSITWTNGQAMLGVYQSSWTNGASVLYADYNNINPNNTTVWATSIVPVVDPNPPGMISIAHSSGSVAIGATNLTESATYTLQGTDDLVFTNWVNLASTTAVSIANWIVPSTNDARFFRVILD